MAVAETGQFSRAAEQCHVSQPSLSRAVREAENLLGVTVFERTARGAEPTAEGREILVAARLVLRDAQHLVDVARDVQGPLRGPLAIGAIPTVGPYVLPPLLPTLRGAYPELQPVLHELQTDRLIRAVEDGDVELALLAFPLPHDPLVGLDWFDEPFLLAVPEGHPLDRPAAIRHVDLEGVELILLQEGHCLRDHVLGTCAADGIRPARLQATGVTALWLMVRAGMGPSLIPATAAAALHQPGDGVTLRAFDGAVPMRTVGLRWRGSTPRGRRYRALGEALDQGLPDLQKSISALQVAGPTPRLVSLVR